MGLVNYMKVNSDLAFGGVRGRVLECSGKKLRWHGDCLAFLHSWVRPSSNFLLPWMSAQMSNSYRVESDWPSLGQVVVLWANPSDQGIGVL